MRTNRGGRGRVLAVALAVVGLAACDDEPTGPGAGAPELAGAGPRFAVSTAGAAPYEYFCGTSLVPDQAAANTRIRADYEKWRSHRVWTQGAVQVPGGLRVTTGPGFVFDIGTGAQPAPYATLSEGQGYGMLLAVYMGDKATFDGLWKYSKAYHNTRGLMKWAVDQNGNALDVNAATDGDEDMAFALLVADKKWGGYWNDLAALVGSMKQHVVDPATYVLKSGDWSGSSSTRVHPGYLDPSYYKAFALYLGDPFWHNVSDRSYQILANVDARSAANGSDNSMTGLVPDRAQVTGDSVASGSYRFSWNAIRAPWRLARDAAWSCDARAKGRLDRMNAFFQVGGASDIRTGYALNGTVVESHQNEATFVGPLTAAALTSTNATYRTAMWNRTVELGTLRTWPGAPQQDTAYYAAELRLMSMLLASGNMEDPLGGELRRRVDDFERDNLAQKWWPYGGAADTVTRQRITPAGVGHGMKVGYAISGWGGVGRDVAASWSGYRAMEFWIRGSGSGNTIRVQIEDADGELFEHRILDDFTDWRFASIPLSTTGFPRAGWQPAGVPNNGLTLSNVRTLQLTPVGGRGSFEIDAIELIPS
ncbi:MAG TPA: glycosyl hydrolase family 8 [Longimicrobiaceae bacterium]